MSQYPANARPPCPGRTPACQGFLTRRESRICAKCAQYRPGDVATSTPSATPAERLAFDQDRQRLHAEVAHYKAQYTEALKTIEQQRVTLNWLDEIRAGIDSTYTIAPKESSGTSEATPVIVASDWHSEEIVKPSQVNGLNEFNPDIEEQRVTRFFQSSLHLIKNHLNPGVNIHTVVLALLGDFITGNIHGEENAESNAFTPIEALLRVENQIKAGIDFYLNHSLYDYIIPCKVGNHSRTTQKVRSATENGHSLETLMYAHLASLYHNEPRVRFVIDDGYHTYLQVYDKTVRFHHGHALKYQGGIGGLFIPAYKAIDGWDDGRKADVDVFGHFHQTKDGGKFLSNGSLIGYNAFAVRIKARFERPQQTLFMIDKKRGRTCSWPVYLEGSR